MSYALKTLLITAAILSVHPVFGANVELLGVDSQAEHGALTAEDTSSKRIIVEQLATASDFIRADKRDAAANIYREIGKNPESTPDQKLDAARRLRDLKRTDEAAAIYSAVAKDPASTIHHKLSAATWLKILSPTEETVAIYSAIAENPESTPDQKLAAARELATLGQRADAGKIYRGILQNPASSTFQRLGAQEALTELFSQSR